jgi:glucose-1-phosphate cytidylyltransferase
MPYKYEASDGAMDTLRDRQVLDDMVERGEMPWRQHPHVPADVAA